MHSILVKLTSNTKLLRHIYKNKNVAHFNQSHLKKHPPYVRVGVAACIGSVLLYDGVCHEFLHSAATWRFFRSLNTAILISLNYLWLFTWHKPHDNDYDAKLKEVHQRSANRLLAACLLNGGLYIKVGQGAAAINHILPKEYTSTLAQLQNECLPSTREDVQKVFLRDFGELPEQIYEKFDYKPVAAASLAQVFKAQLPNGESVAVKVQYSDLEARFSSDLGTLMVLQNIIEWCFKSYNFGWIMRDLRENLMQELNFISEAKNAELCAKQLSKFSFAHIPKVYWDYTKRRILTMEWIDAHKISDISSIKADNLDLRDIDKKLYCIFAEQIFRTGFVHADPHPGNIFVRKNEKSGKADIIILDHGLYEQLPEKLCVPLSEFWVASVLGNEKKMIEAAQKMHIKDHMKFAEILFQQPIRLSGGLIKTKLTQKDIDHMQEMARQNFDLVMSTLKEMPRNMLFIIRNLNTVRSIGLNHGDVVDRPRVMARHAQRCIYANERKHFGYFRWLYRRTLFECSIWHRQLNLLCIKMYFYVLYKLGRAPETATTVFADIMQQASSMD